MTAALAAEPAAGLQACATSGQALGVSRLVEIDTSTGALFGSISTQSREARFLEPKEVVLTFDDGPLPTVTRSILDTLDRFCTKATFFRSGGWALAYPSTVKTILERGHTLGSHTWSHPLNLKRLSLEKATEEIEKGHAAVTLAAGQPVAPFFRFPGLSDSGPMRKLFRFAALLRSPSMLCPTIATSRTLTLCWRAFSRKSKSIGGGHCSVPRYQACNGADAAPFSRRDTGARL